MKRKWVVRKKIGDDLIKKFPEQHPVILQLLANRNLTKLEDQDFFLNPRYEKLSSPFLLSGMSGAVRRVFKALRENEKITIYADYDADAVTACTVLYRFLKKLGGNINWYIPDRFDEGYGLNLEAVKSLDKAGTKLVITVDCGINATEEVSLANSLGLDVVITDHHHIIGELPKALAVVNPKLDSDLADIQGLTGVGVAFKLVQALISCIFPKYYADDHLWEIPELDILRKGFQEELQKKITPGWEKWFLDLVAIGTIADCQSLMGENRILTKYGLKVIGKTKWVGLRQLLNNTGLDENSEFDSYTVGFIIAPRINAAGRIQHADIAFNLLSTDDPTEALMYAGQVESLNLHRQRLTEQIMSEARPLAEEQNSRKVLLLASENWPRGVVGLVASKLTEEYGRPTVVLEKGLEFSTGSARSVGKFNIVEALEGAKGFLDRFGGHAQAAGLTIKNNQLDKLHNILDAKAEQEIDGQDLIRKEFVDLVSEPEIITNDLIEQIKNFEPFGADNPPVTLMLQDLILEQLKIVGSTGKHLKVHAAKDNQVYEFIGFGHASKANHLTLGAKLELVVEPSHNTWNGRKKIQLKIRDLRKV